MNLVVMAAAAGGFFGLFYGFFALRPVGRLNATFFRAFDGQQLSAVEGSPCCA